MAAKVGQYVLMQTIGHGAFGKVKVGVHQETGERVAIKVMDKSSIQKQDLTKNVRREITIMKALKHKNIVRLHHVLTTSSKLYVVMELVTGGELFDVITKHRNGLKERAARRYFQQLVDGVHYCHMRGVYHRDLKPENILLSEDKEVKVTDFGLSSITRSQNGEAEDRFLKTQCGTPCYVAPEVIYAAAEGYSGEKTDAWACGIVLYALLTGSLPFDSDALGELFTMIINKEPNYPDHLSKGACDLLQKLLRKDPKKRYNLSQVKTHPWFMRNYKPDDTGPTKVKKRKKKPSGQDGSDGDVHDEAAHSGDDVAQPTHAPASPIPAAHGTPKDEEFTIPESPSTWASQPANAKRQRAGRSDFDTDPQRSMPSASLLEQKENARTEQPVEPVVQGGVLPQKAITEPAKIQLLSPPAMSSGIASARTRFEENANEGELSAAPTPWRDVLRPTSIAYRERDQRTTAGQRERPFEALPADANVMTGAQTNEESDVQPVEDEVENSAGESTYQQVCHPDDGITSVQHEKVDYVQEFDESTPGRPRVPSLPAERAESENGGVDPWGAATQSYRESGAAAQIPPLVGIYPGSAEGLRYPEPVNDEVVRHDDDSPAELANHSDTLPGEDTTITYSEDVQEVDETLSPALRAASRGEMDTASENWGGATYDCDVDLDDELTMIEERIALELDSLTAYQTTTIVVDNGALPAAAAAMEGGWSMDAAATGEQVPDYCTRQKSVTFVPPSNGLLPEPSGSSSDPVDHDATTSREAAKEASSEPNVPQSTPSTSPNGIFTSLIASLAPKVVSRDDDQRRAEPSRSANNGTTPALDGSASTGTPAVVFVDSMGGPRTDGERHASSLSTEYDEADKANWKAEGAARSMDADMSEPGTEMYVEGSTAPPSSTPAVDAQPDTDAPADIVEELEVVDGVPEDELPSEPQHKLRTAAGEGAIAPENEGRLRLPQAEASRATAGDVVEQRSDKTGEDSFAAAKTYKSSSVADRSSTGSTALSSRISMFEEKDDQSERSSRTLPTAKNEVALGDVMSPNVPSSVAVRSSADTSTAAEDGDDEENLTAFQRRRRLFEQRTSSDVDSVRTPPRSRPTSIDTRADLVAEGAARPSGEIFAAKMDAYSTSSPRLRTYPFGEPEYGGALNTFQPAADRQRPAALSDVPVTPESPSTRELLAKLRGRSDVEQSPRQYVQPPSATPMEERNIGPSEELEVLEAAQTQSSRDKAPLRSADKLAARRTQGVTFADYPQVSSPERDGEVATPSSAQTLQDDVASSLLQSLRVSSESTTPTLSPLSPASRRTRTRSPRLIVNNFIGINALADEDDNSTLDGRSPSFMVGSASMSTVWPAGEDEHACRGAEVESAQSTPRVDSDVSTDTGAVAATAIFSHAKEREKTTAPELDAREASASHDSDAEVEDDEVEVSDREEEASDQEPRKQFTDEQAAMLAASAVQRFESFKISTSRSNFDTDLDFDTDAAVRDDDNDDEIGEGLSHLSRRERNEFFAIRRLQTVMAMAKTVDMSDAANDATPHEPTQVQSSNDFDRLVSFWNSSSLADSEYEDERRNTLDALQTFREACKSPAGGHWSVSGPEARAISEFSALWTRVLQREALSRTEHRMGQECYHVFLKVLERCNEGLIGENGVEEVDEDHRASSTSGETDRGSNYATVPFVYLANARQRRRSTAEAADRSPASSPPPVIRADREAARAGGVEDKIRKKSIVTFSDEQIPTAEALRDEEVGSGVLTAPSVPRTTEAIKDIRHVKAHDPGAVSTAPYALRNTGTSTDSPPAGRLDDDPTNFVNGAMHEFGAQPHPRSEGGSTATLEDTSFLSAKTAHSDEAEPVKEAAILDERPPAGPPVSVPGRRVESVMPLDDATVRAAALSMDENVLHPSLPTTSAELPATLAVESRNSSPRRGPKVASSHTTALMRRPDAGADMPAAGDGREDIGASSDDAGRDEHDGNGGDDDDGAVRLMRSEESMRALKLERLGSATKRACANLNTNSIGSHTGSDEGSSTPSHEERTLHRPRPTQITKSVVRDMARFNYPVRQPYEERAPASMAEAAGGDIDGNLGSTWPHSQRVKKGLRGKSAAASQNAARDGAEASSKRAYTAAGSVATDQSGRVLHVTPSVMRDSARFRSVDVDGSEVGDAAAAAASPPPSQPGRASLNVPRSASRPESSTMGGSGPTSHANGSLVNVPRPASRKSYYSDRTSSQFSMQSVSHSSRSIKSMQSQGMRSKLKQLLVKPVKRYTQFETALLPDDAFMEMHALLQHEDYKLVSKRSDLQISCQVQTRKGLMLVVVEFVRTRLDDAPTIVFFRQGQPSIDTITFNAFFDVIRNKYAQISGDAVLYKP